jgi:hypothetical protein
VNAARAAGDIPYRADVETISRRQLASILIMGSAIVLTTCRRREQ